MLDADGGDVSWGGVKRSRRDGDVEEPARLWVREFAIGGVNKSRREGVGGERDSLEDSARCLGIGQDGS